MQHARTTYLLLFSLFITSLFLILCPAAAEAQAVKRLYLANDEHTDYMWTADEKQYDTAFLKMLDYYLDQIDATQANSPDFQARFNCDGSYWLRVYQKYRSPAQFNRLIARIRSGHISSPLNTLVSTYGGQPTEAVLRGMYYAGKLERRYTLRFPLAVCMENQTLPLGLSSLWAGSGARYSWRGVCGCASKLSDSSLAHRRHQLYRYQGLDSTGVIMKWYNRNPKRSIALGGYAEAKTNAKPTDPAGDMALVVSELDSLCDTTSPGAAYPYNAAGAFGYGWDDLDNYVSPAFITAAQNGTTASRRVRVSNEKDFFRDIEQHYPTLPAETLTYGNEWDLYPASMNETTAQVRRATEKLRAAEALASLVSLHDKDFAEGLALQRQQAWEGYGLYWEHDWTADGPVSKNARAAWQIKMQQHITSYVDSLYEQARRRLGQRLRKNANPRFYVFNSLSWSRNDVADVLYDGRFPVRVVDVQSGREAASQLVIKEGKQFLRIHAADIPPVGYRIFEIQNGTSAALPPAALLQDGYISNARYRIQLSPSGAITEMYDHLAKRQLVQPLNSRYINDLGTGMPANGEPLIVENAGPVSVTVKAVSGNPVKHTVRITLFTHTPRIEFEDSIQSNFSDVKTWAFSFNLERPVTHHEELGAVLTAKRETRGGHYAARNARYDWQTFNHFVDLSEAGYGITLSNRDCSFFKLGNSTPDSLWEEAAHVYALAGGQVDKKEEDTTGLGINRQNGETNFWYRFALLPHPSGFDAVQAMKFSLEHQNPLVTGSVTGPQSATAAATFSLLTVSDPGVLLWSVKPSEEGAKEGLIARFWNLNRHAVAPVIGLHRPIKKAWQTTHLETNLHPLRPVKGKLALPFRAHQINTYRIF